MSTATAPVPSEDLVAFLSDPSSYADRPGAVHLIETHISWVFLTDRHAYKLKRPVRFDFLDFSTPERRRRACLEELRLNRRLAADIYVAVVPITQASSGALELNGAGREVDWVVQMRRLPADRALDQILREARLRPEDADLIARHLVEFYAQLSPVPLPPEEYRRFIESHIRANGAVLLDALSNEKQRLLRIQSAQQRYLLIQAELINDRVMSGRVVDGHGDLRPEHIYLDGRPSVIDCIEFSNELRTIDIADELSFLAMECQRLGDGGLGELVVARYQQACGDEIPASLLAFYRCYRACVRAKVALLRGQQQADNASRGSAALAREYLDLAEHYAAELGPPLLLIVGGLMGTGKTTLAKKLDDAFALDLLSTDRLRRAMLGASPAPAAYSEGNYSPEMRTRVYTELFQQAGEVLGEGRSVIVDGTFLKRTLRDRAYRLAEQHGAVALHVSCECPRSVAYARIQQRAVSGESDSEARTELYDLQARELEPASADEPAISVNTTQPATHQLRAVCAELRDRLFG